MTVRKSYDLRTVFFARDSRSTDNGNHPAPFRAGWITRISQQRRGRTARCSGSRGRPPPRGPRTGNRRPPRGPPAPGSRCRSRWWGPALGGDADQHPPLARLVRRQLDQGHVAAASGGDHRLDHHHLALGIDQQVAVVLVGEGAGATSSMGGTSDQIGAPSARRPPAGAGAGRPDPGPAPRRDGKSGRFDFPRPSIIPLTAENEKIPRANQVLFAGARQNQ